MMSTLLAFVVLGMNVGDNIWVSEWAQFNPYILRYFLAQADRVGGTVGFLQLLVKSTYIYVLHRDKLSCSGVYALEYLD